MCRKRSEQRHVPTTAKVLASIVMAVFIPVAMAKTGIATARSIYGGWRSR